MNLSKNSRTELKSDETLLQQDFTGVVIGVVLWVQEDGTPEVSFPGKDSRDAVPALCTVPIEKTDIGADVALMFKDGNPEQPIILGKLLHPTPVYADEEPNELVQVVADGTSQKLEIAGKEQVTLRCGKASITLTKAGKIILKGAYISSRSTGANRIKGGSVHLN